MPRRFNAALIHCVLISTSACAAIAAASVTQRVSVTPGGKEVTFGGQSPDLSSCPGCPDDARYIVFTSKDSGFVPDDTNNMHDVFVRDRLTDQVTRVSVSSEGVEGNGVSGGGSISADGRLIAFTSQATNLVPDDTNNAPDVFVHDRQTNQTKRVNISNTGEQTHHASSAGGISADGGVVVFASQADNLVSGDSNGLRDIFVADLFTGEVTLVSVNSEGLGQPADSDDPSISANGRLIAFQSVGSGLVAGDTNETYDVFVHDRLTHETIRVSVAADGTQANNASGGGKLSADGQFIAFESAATNLVENDTNQAADVFVRNMSTGQVTRASVSSSGMQADEASGHAEISFDGRYVAFTSVASLDGSAGGAHVYVHDRLSKMTDRVSESSLGDAGNGPCVSLSAPSANGQFIAFSSLATNLVADDSNQAIDVFLHGRSPLCTLADLAPERGDSHVNVDDLLIVISNWGATGSNPADITGNGVVDVDDLLAVINVWGPCE